MAIVPQALVDSLKGAPGFDETAFRAVHQSAAQVVSIRINPLKWTIEKAAHHTPFAIQSGVPWSQYGMYLAQRPSFTFDPLFHAGCYYVQEASSLFLEQALLQTVDLSQPLNVLDLCAAPGGKSTHLQSLIGADSLLVSNEVIRSRTAILKQNLIKWGSENVVVTANDPQHFSRLEGFFDVIVVDAPCSGSGLARRDAEAFGEWSPDNVQLCCGRQKRILANVLPALKQGGILIYATCSYSTDENEAVADWMALELGLENIKLHLESGWGIVESSSEKTSANGYRFYPYHTAGEGFYLTVFRNPKPTTALRWKEAAPERATAAEKSGVQKWLQDDDRVLYRFPYIHGLLKKFAMPYAVLKNYLNIQYAGVAIGAVMHNKLVPEHALALSTVLSPAVPSVPVDYETAIRYLQRSELQIETTPGWQAVAYEGHNIGWINALPNRINNYYPKDWRILKQHPGFEK